jgi:hypothetical protein
MLVGCIFVQFCLECIWGKSCLDMCSLASRVGQYWNYHIYKLEVGYIL